VIHTAACRRLQAFLYAVLALTTAACGSAPPQSSTGIAGGQQVFGADTSEAAVRAFFDAVATDDLPGMWAVFGTEDGAFVERFGIQETELRMFTLAGLLSNTGYDMRVENFASYGPKRVRYVVHLRDTKNGTVDLPVLTVPDADGHWFVEQLDMDRMTPSTSR